MNDNIRFKESRWHDVGKRYDRIGGDLQRKVVQASRVDIPDSWRGPYFWKSAALFFEVWA